MFAGVATGVANAVVEAIATVMSSGCGETPSCCAAPSAIGAMREAVAVLEMKSPVRPVSTKMAVIIASGILAMRAERKAKVEEGGFDN